MGKILDGVEDPNWDSDLCLNMYAHMLRLQAMDQIFYDAQRQGRISFYMTNSGEEAIHIGSASALNRADVIFAQYREAGVLMWRGFSLQQFADQCFSNIGDNAKGRQMPVHYGSAALNFHTISSPLGTQIPQAVGAAYALKLSNTPAIAVTYFGDGAASEGDAHPAMNFAATLEAPMIFFVRNNGYAISTPVRDQYRGDGIVTRAVGYGISAIRVDGNDIFAVHMATAAARQLALSENRPVLIEAMSYRQGHHSTSDDSTRYRSAEEIRQWQTSDDPVRRFRGYLEGKGWWDEEKETNLRQIERRNVLKAMNAAEQKPKPQIEDMFLDVYDIKPRHLVEQEKALGEHLKLYPKEYRTGGHR